MPEITVVFSKSSLTSKQYLLNKYITTLEKNNAKIINIDDLVRENNKRKLGIANGKIIRSRNVIFLFPLNKTLIPWELKYYLDNYWTDEKLKKRNKKDSFFATVISIVEGAENDFQYQEKYGISININFEFISKIFKKAGFFINSFEILYTRDKKYSELELQIIRSLNKFKN